MASDPHPRFAFFDLDGTLLPWDTQLMFCNHVLHRHGWRRVLLVPFFLCLPLAALRILRSRMLKRFFLSYLAGMDRAALGDLATAFAADVARHHVWPGMRAELEARRAGGCVLVLNTASPDIYAEAIARELGFHHCVATRVEIGTRMRVFPQITGPNNKRAAKISAMRERGILPPGTDLPIPGSWAYTDSVVDVPLLECAEHGRLVHPSPAFAAAGIQRGWQILRPDPGMTRTRWRLAALTMLLGFWKYP